MRSYLNFALLALLCVSSAAQEAAPAPQPAKPFFKFQEVMIPVRDGVHLQTVILTPIDQTGATADSDSPHTLWRA